MSHFEMFYNYFNFTNEEKIHYMYRIKYAKRISGLW